MSIKPQADAYRAHVGERTYELTYANEHLTCNGNPVAYSLAPLSEGVYSLLVNGQHIPLTMEAKEAGTVRVTIQGRPFDVQVKDAKALLLEQFGLAEDRSAAEREVRAPMPGLVLKVLVQPGDAVKAGTGLLVLEAMKMENEIKAQGEGVVKTIHVKNGDAVSKKDLLIAFEE